MKTPSLRLLSTAVAFAFLSVQAASAQEIQKANNTTALNLAGSWTGGVVPGSSNVAVYTAGLPALSTALGGDLSWQGIRHAGSGEWTITGSNTLTLGSSGIVMAAGGSGNVVINPSVIQSVDAAYVTLNSRNIFLNGALSGSGNISVSGSGQLVLNGNNSGYTGAISTSGYISVGSDTALGTQTLTMNSGGSLNARGTHRTLANNINVAGNSTFEAVNNTRNLILNGSLSGAGNLTVTGSGSVTLGGNNSGYSGNITVNGNLLAGSNTALGTGALTMNNGSLLGVAENSAALANNIVVASGATVTFQSADIANRNLNLNGTLSGSGNITVAGSGSIVGLHGENSGYSGQITSNGARIQVGSNTALGTGALVMNNGSWLTASAAGSRTLANNITVSGTVVLEAVNASRNITLDGAISGTGSITKSNAGSLTLNGINTYSGNTTVTGGTLNLSSTSELLFVLTDLGSNSVLGSGIANFDGLFRLDISGLTSASGTWSLVNVGTLTESFGSTFGLAFLGGSAFTNAGGGIYTNGDWTFNAGMGTLTLVPEPSAFGLFLGGMLMIALTVRRSRVREA